jgi:hypothetical protein
MSIDYVNKLIILMRLVVSCIVQMTPTYLSWYKRKTPKHGNARGLVFTLRISII